MIEPNFAPLWATLRGHGYLWHRTGVDALEGILHDRQITPNTGQLTKTYGQSRVSFAWHLGAVSLFDFDTSEEADIFEHEWKWGTVLIRQLPAGVIIGIRRDALDPSKLLLPADISANDCRLDVLPEKIRSGRMVIPTVEALHIGPIEIRVLERFILTARNDVGEHLIFEPERGSDILGPLTATAAAWSAEHERRTAERHARGEYTLAEKLEAARREN